MKSIKRSSPIEAIAGIINYCTNDYRFLRFCIEGLKPFCKQIIIPVCTHSVSEFPENQEMLHRSYAEHPECQFVEFLYDRNHLYGLNKGAVLGTPSWLHYWHSTARYVGWHFVRDEIDRILFVDVDEICDGTRFLKWLHENPHREYDAIHFSSYLYFREPRYRSTTNANSALLLKKNALSPELILNDHERPGIFYHHVGKKKNSVRGLDNRPMIHHYSWARTKEELLFKVRNWGHRYDKNWESLIEEEFSREFQGHEHFSGFKYRTVKSQHPILEQDTESLKSKTLFRDIPKNHFPNVACVNAKDIFRINLEKVYLNLCAVLLLN